MITNRVILQDVQTIYQADIEWEKFRNTTILISGANGFLPAYLVESLLYLNKVDPTMNAMIIGLVRNLEAAKKRFADYEGNKHLQFLVQDVSNPIQISSNIDYIIHAASQASPKYYAVDPVGTLKANVLGTLNLLQLALEKKVKSFLFFSSGEVYGQLGPHQIPTPENVFGYVDPTNIRSCYAESKRMGENICVSYFHQYGVPAKIVRPFHTYGPKMQLNDGRVYADFVSDIVNNRNIIMKSDGSAIRPFCYLADATSGFFTVLLKGNSGEAYNVGNPDEAFNFALLPNNGVGLARLEFIINNAIKIHPMALVHPEKITDFDDNKKIHDLLLIY